MNPVETPMMQLMQAFGATSPQSVATMFGIQDASGDIQENYAALFSGYLQSVEGGKPSDATTGIINLSKNSTQPYSAAPEDFALAVNPVEQALRPVGLDGLISPEDLQAKFGQLSAEEAALLPERLAAFALGVDYKAAQPVALTPENLQALQSAIAEVSAVQQAVTAGHNGLATAQAQGQSGILQASGQFLPAKELAFLFGLEGELPASLRGQAQGVIFPQGQAAPGTTPAENAAGTDQAAYSAASTSNEGAPKTGAEIISKAIAPDLAKAADPSRSAEITAAEGAAKEVSKIASTQKVLPDVIVEDGDAEADGQILSVLQKQSKSNNTSTAQAGQTTPSTQANAETATAAATAQVAAKPQSSIDKERTDLTKQSSASSADATSAAAKAQQPVVTAPVRPTIDWTSPWATPERAAGWADGTAAGLISSGLAGMAGQNAPLAGLGIMGGRADPLLGKQVAKQVNLNITRTLKAGDNQFAMRMDPPELGRVSVKMTFLANGMVKAQVMAERPETLEMLQREIKGLERAVEAGGHKSEPGGISFSLDSGNGESAGKAFAEAMQEEQLNEQKAKTAALEGDIDGEIDELEEEIDLDAILAQVTPETGLDVRV